MSDSKDMMAKIWARADLLLKQLDADFPAAEVEGVIIASLVKCFSTRLEELTLPIEPEIWQLNQTLRREIYQYQLNKEYQLSKDDLSNKF